MRRFVGALSALAFASVSFGSPSSAHAQAWPSPADLGQALQRATTAANDAARGGCPTVEIAPGVFLPVCADALPRPPPGVTLPEAVFGPLVVAPSVDLRTTGLDGPVKNQEQTGVCYAFALSSVLETSLRRQGRADTLSPLHIVAAKTWSGLWSTQRGEAVGAEATWPYDPVKACRFETGPDSCEQSYRVQTNSWQSDPRLVAERERARAAGFVVAGKATTLRRDPVQGIVSALSQQRAVYAIVNIDSAAWGFRGVRGGVLPEYARADRGAHAVAVVGYRGVPGARQLLLHNSWGRSWGEGGHVWMSEAGFRRHFVDAYLVDASSSFAPPSVPPSLPAFPWPVPSAPASIPWFPLPR